MINQNILTIVFFPFFQELNACLIITMRMHLGASYTVSHSVISSKIVCDENVHEAN